MPHMVPVLQTRTKGIMNIPREKYHPFHGAHGAEKFLKGSPLQVPGLTVVGIIIFDAPSAPVLDGLDKPHSEYGGGRYNQGNIRVLPFGSDDLSLDGIGSQQSRKTAGRAIEALRTGIHHENLVMRARNCVIPAQCLI